MSWLSSLFGGGGEDPEAVRQRQAEAARLQAVAAQQSAEKQQQMQLDYLNSLRADEAAKEAALAAKDPTSTRQAADRTVSSFFTPEYANQYLPDTATDPLENEVYTQQRTKADDYINNLIKRNVITDVGAGAARKTLDDQGARVRTQLDQIGKTLLGAGRETLGGIEGRARSAASNLNVGDSFDIAPYSTAFNTQLGQFNTSLGDQFKGSITGDLFDTSNLSSIAGGAQGAQNLGFDPGAVAGGPAVVADAGAGAESDPFAPGKPIQKRTTAVF